MNLSIWFNFITFTKKVLPATPHYLDMIQSVSLTLFTVAPLARNSTWVILGRLAVMNGLSDHKLWCIPWSHPTHYLWSTGCWFKWYILFGLKANCQGLAACYCCHGTDIGQLKHGGKMCNINVVRLKTLWEGRKCEITWFDFPKTLAEHVLLCNIWNHIMWHSKLIQYTPKFSVCTVITFE